MVDLQPVVSPAGAPAPKPPWQSKTMWAATIATVVTLAYPPAAVWIAANPALFTAGLSGVFAVLRLVSHGKVTITD